MQKTVCRKSSCAGAWQHFSREPDLQAWAQDPDLMHTCELEQVLGVRFVHLHQQSPLSETLPGGAVVFLLLVFAREMEQRRFKRLAP